MRNSFLFWALILGALVLSACGSDGRYQVTLITEGNHLLSGPLNGDLIMLGGEVLLDDSANLDGSAHVLSGSLRSDGQINGDISIFSGELELGSRAAVSGTINHGGGELSIPAGAQIIGGVNSGSGIQIPSINTPQQQHPAWLIFRWVLGSLLAGILGAFIQRYFPRTITRIGDAMLKHAAVSAAMGVLVGIVAITLLVLMTYTILLIPVAILGLIILVIAILLSWIAAGIILGDYLARLRNKKPGTTTVAFLGVTIFILLLNMLTSIPAVGGIIGIFMGLLGLGSMFLTRFGLRHFIPENIT